MRNTQKKSSEQIPPEIKKAAESLLCPYVDFNELLSRVQTTNQNPMEERRYLTIADVEHLYGLRRWSIRRYLRSGKLKGAKMANSRSGKVLIERISLEELIATHSKETPKKGAKV